MFEKQEIIFANVSMWFGLATMTLFLMHYCVQHWSPRSQIVLSVVLAGCLMVQFISLLEVFALMSNIATKLQATHHLASFHYFHRKFHGIWENWSKSNSSEILGRKNRRKYINNLNQTYYQFCNRTVMTF